MVTRDFVSSIYGKTQLEIVELREGSWFGELAGLLQTTAYFGLRAGKQKSKGEKLVLDGIEHAQLYELDMEVLREICADYPQFKTQIYVRDEVRHAYFKHIAQLKQGEFGYKMKILALEKQFTEDPFGPAASKGDSERSFDSEQGRDYTYQRARSHSKTLIATKLVDLRAKVSKLFGLHFAEETISAIINRVLIMHYGTRGLDPSAPRD